MTMRGFGEIAERLRRSTVQIHVGRGGGSGVVWGSDGLLLTNAHVARAAEAEVELWDGRRLHARVTARDRRRDLALLRAPANDLEPAAAGDSSALRPGEMVMAIGSPLGFAGALSTGVVHSVGALPGLGRQRWIRANLRLAPGNSGGPLANAQGLVVGINTAIVNGLGIAAPIASALDFLRHGPPPSLGATLRPTRAGLLILELTPGGAAEASSLREGDVLLCSVDELAEALDSGHDVIRIRFLRDRGMRVREVAGRVRQRAEAA
jgi:serine protease Do